jgi:hypothetical protein
MDAKVRLLLHLLPHLINAAVVALYRYRNHLQLLSRSPSLLFFTVTDRLFL